MTHIKHFEKNTKGRDFFTTDIHGHFDLLHEAMRDVVFDTSKDRLFCGGDWCDRGPNSDWVLDYINEPWVHSVQANHEAMVINYIECLAEIGDENHPAMRQPFEMLFCNGGKWFFDQSVTKQMQIYESFKALPLGVEVETDQGLVGIVHAEVPGGDWKYFKEMAKAELAWNGEAVAQWARTKYDRKDTKEVKNIDIVLVGHTPTESGEIEQLGNVKYCDLGSFFRDKICFLQIQ